MEIAKGDFVQNFVLKQYPSRNGNFKSDLEQKETSQCAGKLGGMVNNGLFEEIIYVL